MQVKKFVLLSTFFIGCALKKELILLEIGIE